MVPSTLVPFIFSSSLSHSTRISSCSKQTNTPQRQASVCHDHEWKAE